MDALFIPRWETLKRWSIQHFPPPPRAPRRARFPRPPLEKRDGQFNISPPDRDRFIFVSSFAAYLATYPSAADRDRFTFVSSFAAYFFHLCVFVPLASRRRRGCCPATATGENPHHVRRRPERLNCCRPSPFSVACPVLPFVSLTLRYTRLFVQLSPAESRKSINQVRAVPFQDKSKVTSIGFLVIWIFF